MNALSRYLVEQSIIDNEPESDTFEPECNPTYFDGKTFHLRCNPARCIAAALDILEERNALNEVR